MIKNHFKAIINPLFRFFKMDSNVTDINVLFKNWVTMQLQANVHLQKSMANSKFMLIQRSNYLTQSIFSHLQSANLNLISFDEVRKFSDR